MGFLSWLDRWKNLIVNVVAIVFLSYFVSVGRVKLGVWGFVVFIVVFGLWKVWRQRWVWLRTVRMGADHLRLMRECSKKDDDDDDDDEDKKARNKKKNKNK